MKIDVFKEYLERIENPENRAKTKDVLQWVADTFPALTPRIAWNQPMFTDHGTYIIGYSVSKKHLAVSPEREGILRFADEIQKSGYAYSKMLFRIPWESKVDYALLERIIAFTIADKANCTTFWRK